MARGKKKVQTQKVKNAKAAKSKTQTALAPRVDGNFLTSFNGFGDDEPTRNKKELRIRVWDWIEWDLVDQSTPQPIGLYGLDLTQNFFGTVNPLVGIDQSKNRVHKVTLELLTPASPVTFGDNARADLILVLASVPVIASDDGGSSLVGQSTTVIHPDVRRPWVKVGEWNFTEIFTNSQFLPVYFAADTETMELFRYSVVDAVTGNPLFLDSATPNPLQFRVSIELGAPITLVPEPRRFTGRANVFAGAGYSPVVTEDDTPTQYELMHLTNIV